MSIFELKIEFGRINVVLFKFSPFFNGIKFHFRNILAAKKNVLIPLGTNCYPRMLLTKYCIKCRKKQGELSFPFDLNVSNMKAISHFISSDFKDFFDEVVYNEKNDLLFNPNYGMYFPHEKYPANQKIKFVKRYTKRIENFYQVIKSSKNLCFISVIRDENVSAEVLNEIYFSLKKKCAKDFKYIVVQALFEGNYLDSENLLQDIHYVPMKRPTKDYFETWFLKDLQKNPQKDVINAFTIDCLSEINKFINL